MKLFTSIIALWFLCFNITAFAQTPETPRAKILEVLGLNGEPQARDMEEVSGVILEEALELESVAVEAIDETLEIEIVSDAGATKTALEITETPRAPEQTPEQTPELMPEKLALLPFYFSAKDYLQARGAGNIEQTVLEYTVTKTDIKTDITGLPQKVVINIGQDFAAIMRGGQTKIYDFKFNRFLTITPYLGFGSKEKQWTFSNNSLYAKVYRDVATVRQVTQNGSIQSISLGPNIALDAFWIESAMSWSVNPAGIEINIDDTGDGLTAARADGAIFKAKFDGQAYPRASFIALAHLEWPIYSEILQTLEHFEGAPSFMEVISYGPKNMGGQSEVWKLVSHNKVDEAFPLPTTALGIAQRKPIAPLVFVIDEAVHNRALDGLHSDEEIEKYFGDDYQKTALSLEELKDVMPDMDKKETEPLVLRQAAMARALLSSKAAQREGVEKLSPQALLEISLIKDPYDPNTYVGLAQVLAAKGAYMQSWDIYDALRAGLPTASAVSIEVDDLENKLRNLAPHHFLQP